MITTLAAQAAIALENARLFQETTRHVSQLQTLHIIDTAINSSVDLRKILDVFLEQTLPQLELHAADILVFDPYTEKLKYAVGRGFRTSALQHTNISLGDGLAGRAALEDRLVYIPELNIQSSGLARSPELEDEEFVAYLAIPLKSKGLLKGVLEIFHRESLVIQPNWLDFLETLAGQAAIAVDNYGLFSELERSKQELEHAYDATIEGWSKALDLRDEETEGHTQRVVKTTLQLARLAGVPEHELVHIRRGGLLHDIGKMGVPDSILLKPGPLTEEEWAIMRQHPQFAYDLLSQTSYLRLALEIPYCHHEKWDGSGYPRGLKGEEIPLSARLFAVVDVWDALTSDRPYRKAWSHEEALKYIKEQAGVHFDPAVVKLFLVLFDQ